MTVGGSVRAFEIVIPGVSGKGRLGRTNERANGRVPLYVHLRTDGVEPRLMRRTSATQLDDGILSIF